MGEVDTLREIYRAVGRLESKVDVLLQAHAQHAGVMANTRERVTRLEGWRWFMLGAAGAVAVVVDFAFRVLGVRD